MAAQAGGSGRECRGSDPHRSCSSSLCCWRRRAFSFTGGCEFLQSSTQRALTRLTFDDGLQIGATWSPDGRFIAYSSNRGGKFDIWVQQVSGGDPIQITKGPGSQLAAGLVARRQVHCVSFRRRRGRLVRRARAWRARTGKKNRAVRILPSLVAKQFADTVPDGTNFRPERDLCGGS